MKYVDFFVNLSWEKIRVYYLNRRWMKEFSQTWNADCFGVEDVARFIRNKIRNGTLKSICCWFKKPYADEVYMLEFSSNFVVKDLVRVE